MKPQFTPGPWVYREANNGEVVHYIGTGTTHTTVASYVDPHDGPLIAAAPDLLAACLAWNQSAKTADDIDRAYELTRAAIRKATGQA